LMCVFIYVMYFEVPKCEHHLPNKGVW
jgi:hypothetical protein